MRDLSDEDAYMQLVLCNTQSELHPLEEGKHAAESGMDLKAYAERAGKARQSLQHKLYAWRVVATLPHVGHAKVDEQALFNEWRHNQVDNPHGVGEFEDYLKEFYVDRAKRLDIARDSWRNLAEIHAAPKWVWAALVEKMVSDDWTVQVTREKVGKVKELIKELPSWIDENALAHQQTQKTRHIAGSRRLIRMKLRRA